MNILYQAKKLNNLYQSTNKQQDVDVNGVKTDTVASVKTKNECNSYIIFFVKTRCVGPLLFELNASLLQDKNQGTVYRKK